MRGKPISTGSIITSRRITPAGAGKTAYVNRGWAGAEDHPRRCGENGAGAYHFRGYTGSPPQVRGKPHSRLLSFATDRITPAGAGKTKPLDKAAQRDRDHPRRCGENCCKFSPVSSPVGSPPQVRGKHLIALNIVNGNRITPAGAGKTQFIVGVGGRNGDHPRRCGENSSPPERIPDKQGSPPQVRGKRVGYDCICVLLRITPAGAGKTR